MLENTQPHLEEAHTMREDVWEAQQQRRVQAAPLQRLHHFQHVDGVAACARRQMGRPYDRHRAC